jgi:CheY-like chemotaxis protein
MTHETLHTLKSAAPFRPFRLVLADGRALDVRHPNHVWPGEQRTLVGAPDDPDRTWLSLDTATIDRVEFLDAAAGPGRERRPGPCQVVRPASPPDPSSARRPDLELTRDVGEQLLDEAREVARRVGDRVRRMLPPPPPLRVLVVDDHPDAADALAAVLDLLGHEVRVCYDGPSALATAHDFRPDVCLLDLMMPRMDGVELAGLLRTGAGRRPMLVVATTALGTLESRTLTAVAGFHYHLVKPVESADLVAALDRFAELYGGSLGATSSSASPAE